MPFLRRRAGRTYFAHRARGHQAEAFRTLTYRDVFGHAHATGIDYTTLHRCENAAFTPNTDKTLENLQSAANSARMPEPSLFRTEAN
jgi:hypothetical protein